MHDSFVGHKIPEDILTKFTYKFWKIFANELSRVFEYDVSTTHLKNNSIKALYYIAGTAGWAEAFIKTCIDFNLNNVVDYYCTLDQYDLDAFDNEIHHLLREKYESGEIK